MNDQSKTNEPNMYLQEWASRVMEQVFSHAVVRHHTISKDQRYMLMAVGNILRAIRNDKDYVSIVVESDPPTFFMDDAPWWGAFADFLDRNNLGRFENGPARTFADLIRAVVALTKAHPEVASAWATP